MDWALGHSKDTAQTAGLSGPERSARTLGGGLSGVQSGDCPVEFLVDYRMDYLMTIWR